MCVYLFVLDPRKITANRAAGTGTDCARSYDESSLAAVRVMHEGEHEVQPFAVIFTADFSNKAPISVHVSCCLWLDLVGASCSVFSR